MRRHLAAVAAIVMLSGCASPPRPSQSDQLNASGSAALQAGRPSTAAARFSAAAESSRAIDDRISLSRDLHNRGMALLAAGETRSACEDLNESLRLAANAPADDRVRTRLALANGLAALERLDEATACIELALAESAITDPLRARALASRAALALGRGDVPAATTDLTAAERLSGNDLRARGVVAVNRGHVALRNGDAQGAGTAYAAAAEAFRQVVDHGGLAAALEGQANAAESLGDRTAAAQHWRRAADVPYGGSVQRARRLAQAERLSR